MKAVYFNIILFLVGLVACIRVIPERAAMQSMNEKYLENASVFVTRYSRRSPYYFNVVGRNKHTWDNNVTVNLVLYEYLHNEYRRSFVEFHFGVCNMLNFDPYVGAMVASAGITCPVYPKLYRMENMTIPGAGFKYVMPFKKFMAQLYFTITATGEDIATGFSGIWRRKSLLF